MNKEDLIAKFETGDKPTGDDFKDLIDNSFNVPPASSLVGATHDYAASVKLVSDLNVDYINRLEALENVPAGSEVFIDSDQRFDITTIVSGRLDNTGAVNESVGFSTTGFIAIKEGAKNVILAKNFESGIMNFNNLVFYDADKRYMSLTNTGNINIVQPDEYGRVTFPIPANAKFLRLSVQGVYQRLGVFFDKYSNNFNYYRMKEKYKNNWYGKKVVCFGDSLVGGASNSVNTWLGIIAKELGVEPVNRGIGGSTVLTSDTERIAWVSDGVTVKSLGEYGEYVSRPSGTGGGGGNTSATQPAGTVEITSSMCTDARVNTIPTDAYAIIILAGTNGFDDAGYRTMLQKIFTRCPSAKVFCCTLPFRYEDANKTTITELATKNTTIRNIATELGCVVVDLKAGECVNHYNSSLFMLDSVHANDAGNKVRATIIKGSMNHNEPLS